MKLTMQAVYAVKQSIFLDVYIMVASKKRKEEEEAFFGRPVLVAGT
jgi:hypothetical protein